MTSKRILLVLGCLLIVALGAFLALRLEWSDREVWVGYQGEARVNDFLAAQRLLQNLGRATRSLETLPSRDQLKDPKDVLLMPRRNLRMSPGQAAGIAGWVASGGLLIAEGAWGESEAAAETQDLLFAAFGARLVPRVEPEHKDEAASKAWRQAHRRVKLNLDGQPFDTAFAPDYALKDLHGRAIVAQGDDTGLKLLVVPHGKGRAVLCSNLGFLDNFNLPLEDHAPLLIHLTAGRPAGSRIWFVLREEAPSLLRWLREKAWAPLGALALLVLVWLWRELPRFGPRLPDPAPGGRSLLEHLTACGRFQWKAREGRSLLLATREALMRELLRVHPAWHALSPDQLCRRLANFADLPEPQVFKALRFDRFPDARSLTEAIRTLDQLRKLL